MGYLLNVSEVLEFAVYIEQNGYEFYVEAMKKFADPDMTELFQYLADEEFKHEKFFAKLKEAAGHFTPPESYDGEYQAYMKEFCKAHSLANREAIKPKLAKLKTMNEVLDMALGFEKDSVVFFSELKGVVHSEQSGPVEKVIREELVHIRKIMDYRSRLQAR